MNMQGIYLVTDRSLCSHRSLKDIVLAAVKGGATMVQLREKDLSTRRFVEEAVALKRLLEPFHVPLIINDRLDVVQAAGAHGIHVGQDDMPCSIARQILGPKAIIGLSVETMDQVVEADSMDVDYLGVSGIFPTPTKTDLSGFWGLDGLANVRVQSRFPLVAIGGIHAENAALLRHAGADMIAVVSAICGSADPETATRNLLKEFNKDITVRNETTK